MTSNGSRYQHLLQPIRDLSQNWNIDLAQELEEYLEELENLKIAFDPSDKEFSVLYENEATSNSSLLNFAEAALVIQNTSAIYSRKVEYLYALVFQALEHLTQKPKAGSEAKEDSSPTEDSGWSDVFAHALPRYDQVQEAKNINMKRVKETEVEEISVNGEMTVRKPRNASRHENIAASFALLSALVHEEGDSTHDAFKILSCPMHPSGVLLIDESTKKYFESSEQRVPEKNAWPMRDAQESALETEETNDVNEAEDVEEAMDFEETGSTGDHVEERDGDASQADEKDPWALLDPYDASKAVHCPFVKGKTYTVPRKSKASKSSDALDLFPSLHNGKQVSVFESSLWSGKHEENMKRFQRKYCKTPLLLKQNKCLWKLQGMYTRIARRRKILKSQSADIAAVIAHEDMEEPAFDYDDEDVEDTEPAALEQTDMPEQLDYNGFKSNQTKEVPAAAPISSYEELCRQHIQTFMQGTEKYLRETQLSKKVAVWQDKLSPFLKEQAGHSPFDIQRYGTQILTRIKGSEETEAPSSEKRMVFEDMVAGMPPYEVCRTFLASLQLANNGSVQLQRQESLDSFHIQLS